MKNKRWTWIRKTFIRNPKRNFVPGHERVFVCCPMCNRPIDFNKMAKLEAPKLDYKIQSFGGDRGITWQTGSPGAKFVFVTKSFLAARARAILVMLEGEQYEGKRVIEEVAAPKRIALSTPFLGHRRVTETQFRGHRE